MAQNTDVLDLGRFALAPGEGRHAEVGVRVGSLDLAGERYATEPESVPVRLDMTRMAGGWSLRLRYAVTVGGPCMRCLDRAARAVEIDVREVHQPSDGGEELSSPYLDGDELDVHAWARDSLALELPAQIVCSDDCKGICPVCGENLNTAPPDHQHERAPDPRWAKLSEIRFE
jgi:uncharacterized protein